MTVDRRDGDSQPTTRGCGYGAKQASGEVILNPRHPYARLLAAASPDPRRPHGPSDRDEESAVAADAVRTYDHHTGQWDQRP